MGKRVQTSISDIQERAAKLRRIVSLDDTSEAAVTTSAGESSPSNEPSTQPHFEPTQVILSLLRYRRISASTHKFEDLEHFFYKPSKEDYDSYGTPVMKAIAAGDVNQLKQLKKDGGVSMSACNVVGESLLQKACRRGKTDVVRYLVEEAQVPINTHDAYGRTPMHDLCWASEPNFEMMNILLSKCPDLLLVEDARGHAPLRYAPRHWWKVWVRHLARNFHMVKPKFLH